MVQGGVATPAVTSLLTSSECDLCPDWVQAEIRAWSWSSEEGRPEPLVWSGSCRENNISMKRFPCTRSRRANTEDAVVFAEENVNVISPNKEGKGITNEIKGVVERWEGRGKNFLLLFGGSQDMIKNGQIKKQRLNCNI